MLDLTAQILALGLLVSGVVFGYWRWIKPRRRQLSQSAVGLLALLVLTLMGGFIGAPIWWVDAEQSFAWDLPPLASRMLAVASWTFALVFFLTLKRPTNQRVRLALILLNVYLWPLALAIVGRHLDRFDFGKSITYGFFVIAIGMAAAGLWFLWRQPTIETERPITQPAPAKLPRAWLSMVVMLTGLWGLALFLTDDGPSTLVWVWPGDLLTSRLIAVMLWTIAAGSLYAMRYRDIASIMLTAMMVYGVGVALATGWNAFWGLPVRLSYFVAFLSMGLVSAMMLKMQRDAIA